MGFSTLQAWLQWQETLHPNPIDLGLERVATVYQRLSPSAPTYKVVTVAGTNGKGSCVAMLESILLQAGYKVGVYTSPHLLRYNERIRLSGQAVEDEMICAAFERINQQRREQSLTYFEFGTLAALDIFNAQDLDVVILEVGMGGRLDATNIVDADVALITNVGLDHTQWLGQTLEEIAREKAGIIKSAKPVVCADSNNYAEILNVSRQAQSECYLVGRDYQFTLAGSKWTWFHGKQQLTQLSLPALAGDFQMTNAAAVLMVLHLIKEDLPVDLAQLSAGLAAVNLPGRFQLVPGDIPVILDVAHNPAAMFNLATLLASRAVPGHTHVVFGSMADKDITAMLRHLSAQAQYWYFTCLADVRGANCADLKVCASSLGLPTGLCYERPNDALQAAKEQAKYGDRILVTGSFLTVAEIMANLG